jgi:hypothetical protein
MSSQDVPVVGLPKALSKAESLAAIRCFAATITSCSVAAAYDWKGMVVGVLSARNSARRSSAKP